MRTKELLKSDEALKLSELTKNFESWRGKDPERAAEIPNSHEAAKAIDARNPLENETTEDLVK